MDYKFFHITVGGVSLGIFAGDSPADAALEMSADANPATPHNFLCDIVDESSVRPRLARNFGLLGQRILKNDEIEPLAETFLALPTVQIDDLSSCPRTKLDRLAQDKGYSDWNDFLAVQAAKTGFWASKTLAKELLITAV